jgi:hypothetical protein
VSLFVRYAESDSVANHMRLCRIQEMRVSRIRQFMAHPMFDKLLTVAACDSAGSGQDMHELWQSGPTRSAPSIHRSKPARLIR